MIGAPDVTEMKEDVVLRLQSWGFHCCLVGGFGSGTQDGPGHSPGADATTADRRRVCDSGGDGGRENKGPAQVENADGDIERIVENCGAAVVVLSRGFS